MSEDKMQAKMFLQRIMGKNVTARRAGNEAYRQDPIMVGKYILRSPEA